MNPASIFQIANVLPLPIWAIWVLAPRSRAARYLATALWPWVILCALYAVLVAVGMVGSGFDPRAFNSLAGVMSLLATPWGALPAWVHFLAFDTFTARWMMNDAPHAGYRLSPILVLTLMFGPAGLLLYLAVRRFVRAPAAA